MRYALKNVIRHIQGNQSANASSIPVSGNGYSLIRGQSQENSTIVLYGKTLFVRTMSAEETSALSALTPEEFKGAAVIIDTAVRYLRGMNSSEHMRVFAEDVFRIMREGADSSVLHHSAKGTKESTELSLENAMRGSGELGAFVSSCWATGCKIRQPVRVRIFRGQRKTT